MTDNWTVQQFIQLLNSLPAESEIEILTAKTYDYLPGQEPPPRLTANGRFVISEGTTCCILTKYLDLHIRLDTRPGSDG